MIATIVVMKERQYGPRPPIDRRMPTRDAVQAATATLTPDYPPIDDAELSDLTNVRRHHAIESLSLALPMSISQSFYRSVLVAQYMKLLTNMVGYWDIRLIGVMLGIRS